MKITFDAFKRPDLTPEEMADLLERIAESLRAGFSCGDADGNGWWTLEVKDKVEG